MHLKQSDPLGQTAIAIKPPETDAEHQKADSLFYNNQF